MVKFWGTLIWSKWESRAKSLRLLLKSKLPKIVRYFFKCFIICIQARTNKCEDCELAYEVRDDSRPEKWRTCSLTVESAGQHFHLEFYRAYVQGVLCSQLLCKPNVPLVFFQRISMQYSMLGYLSDLRVEFWLKQLLESISVALVCSLSIC